MSEFPEPEAEPADADATRAEASQSFGEWLKQELVRNKMNLADLSAKSGITYTGLWNIVKGYTVSPREETRKRVAEALKSQIPADIENAIETEQKTSVPGHEWYEIPPSFTERRSGPARRVCVL